MIQYITQILLQIVLAPLALKLAGREIREPKRTSRYPLCRVRSPKLLRGSGRSR